MEQLNEGKAGGGLMTMAGALLALLWIASMSVVDGNACNSAPACLGLAGVLVLAVLAMLAGQRPARPGFSCLLSVVAGLYFLLRCAASESVVEAWREAALLLGAFTFYGAGYVFAQRRAGRALAAVMALAVLANILYFFLLRQPGFAQEWTGRPEVSLTGVASRGTTLFVYKNFAGIFLMLAGAALFCRPLWAGRWGWGSAACALAGLAGMACACFCGTRAIFLMLPLLLLFACALGLAIRVYGGRPVGWVWPLLTALLVFALVVAVAALFLGDSLLAHIASIDTHLRTQIWRDVCRVAPDAPWCGYGACATQWMLVPIFNSWETPNFAHNEYLQAWCDYGVVGIVLVVAVIAAHLVAGFRKLASEDLEMGRRVLTAMAMLVLAVMACCAVVDFVWHSFALAGMTAFACGLLASPAARRDESFWRRRNWAKGSRPPLRPVRPLGRSACALACMGALALAAACLWLGWRLLPAWEAQWEYNAAVHRHMPAPEQRRMLAQVLPAYPDTGIMDHYIQLPREGEPWDWERLVSLLRVALEAHPRQLFTVTMLVDALGRSGHAAEAEMLLREKYLPGGQRGTCLTSWPAYYCVNLLRWGKEKMAEGEPGAALSMMAYAFRVGQGSGRLLPNTVYRSGLKNWVEPARNPKLWAFIESCRADLRLLRALGVTPDDRWQRPLRAGDPPALYARWGNPKGK